MDHYVNEAPAPRNGASTSEPTQPPATVWDRTATFRGTRADAERELAAMVASVQAVRVVGVRSRVGELLEAWFAIASTGWAPTTIRQTRTAPARRLSTKR